MSQTIESIAPPRSSRIEWGTILKKLGPFIGLAFVFGLFAVLRWDTFVTADNIQTMLLQTAVVGTGALGMTLIIISAGVDLSVGSVVALSTVAVALLLRALTNGDTANGVGIGTQLVAAAGGAAIGVASGFITGNFIVGQIGRVLAAILAVATIAMLNDFGCKPWIYWSSGFAVLIVLLVLNELFLRDRESIKHLNLPPFIATLGMMGALRGAAHWLGNNGTVVVRGQMWLKTLLITPEEKWKLLPTGVWLMLILAAVVAFVLKYTKFGRHVFAIGSNEQTARLCGINVERTKLLIYMIGVGFAGIAGVLQFSYLGKGDSTAAQGMELNIIAAVVIGGASLSGGEGSVVGSLIGALIMTVVANGCSQMELKNYWQEIVTGGIIIVAVLLDRLRHRQTS